MKAHFKASSLLTCKRSHDCQTEFIFQPSTINYISRYSNAGHNKQKPIIGADKEENCPLFATEAGHFNSKKRSKMKKKEKRETTPQL